MVLLSPVPFVIHFGHIWTIFGGPPPSLSGTKHTQGEGGIQWNAPEWKFQTILEFPLL